MNKKSKALNNNLLVMPDASKTKKKERERYLKKRINNLFDNLEEWIADTGYILKRISINLDNNSLPAAEIYLNKKIITSLKPIGLWGFGVNCQINIEAKNEKNYIYDLADETSEPQWELVYISGKKSKKLNKILFRNLLKRITGE